MRILQQFQLYVLLCCGTTEGFTEKKVDLGQNVTLQCQVAVKDVYWFLMKPSERPVFILRSFLSRPVDPHYSNPDLRKTFILLYNSSLFIHNISTNELGYYYCIQTQTGLPPSINTGIRLYIQNHSDGCQTSVCTLPQNQTADNPEASRWPTPYLISVILNCALVIVLTGFTIYHCARLRKTQAQPSDPGLQPHSTFTLYDEVKYTAANESSHVQMTDPNSLYSLLQLPHP